MDTYTKNKIAAAVAKGRVPREDVERHAAGTYRRPELDSFDPKDLEQYLKETA